MNSKQPYHELQAAVASKTPPQPPATATRPSSRGVEDSATAIRRCSLSYFGKSALIDGQVGSVELEHD